MVSEMKIPSDIGSVNPGTVQVKVLKATNLPVGDFLSSDPYVKVSLADQIHKTTVKRRDLNPTWNESFVFGLRSDSDSVLTAEVWDKDRLSRDDFLGKVSIDLKAVQDNGSVADITAKLGADKKSASHDLGTLSLRLRFPCKP